MKPVNRSYPILSPQIMNSKYACICASKERTGIQWDIKLMRHVHLTPLRPSPLNMLSTHLWSVTSNTFKTELRISGPLYNYFFLCRMIIFYRIALDALKKSMILKTAGCKTAERTCHARVHPFNRHRKAYK